MIKKTTGEFYGTEKKNEIRIPDADYHIEKDDVIVVFGSDDNIRKLTEEA